MTSHRTSLLKATSAFALGLALVFGLLRPSMYAQGDLPRATVKVWDTGVAIPPALSLGLTPGESIEDPTGLTKHDTGYPTVVTVYANGSHPRGRSGLAYWNPDGNVFSWYGKTIGFPSGVAINRGGPTRPGGPIDPGSDGLPGTLDDRPTSFGPGDVWVAGHQLELLYVHIAGTDMFRTFGMSDPLGNVVGKRAWGVTVDQVTGNVYLTEPEGGRVARLDPVTTRTKVWLFGGAPAYLAIDAAGYLYTTLSASDAVVRIAPDDSATLWRVPNVNGIAPSFRIVPHVAADAGIPGDNANGILTTDADGNVWFLETNSNEVARLSGGADGVLGTADDEICEFTSPGVLAPQQIAVSSSGPALQAYVTEGAGNAVTVLTQAEADLAAAPTRVCTRVPGEAFPISTFDAATAFFDERIMPLRTPIVPTVHEVLGAGGPASGTTRTADGKLIPPVLRFSPMPNPLLSLDGTALGDAGNGFPSGLTSVYANNRVAGTYLEGNKHFEVTSEAIVAPSQPSATRMTGGGNTFTSNDRRVTHGFVLHCAPVEKRNDVLAVSWEKGHRFHLTTVTARWCSDDPALDTAGFDTHKGRGIGRYDGAPASIEWTFTDGGKPAASDFGEIVIRDGAGRVVLDISGTLWKGDHRVRTP
jgi:hypothetical protein